MAIDFDCKPVAGLTHSVGLGTTSMARGCCDGECITEMEQQKYKDYLLVPDIMDAPPKETCDVVFSSGAKAVLGNELKAEDLREKPTKVVYTAEKGAYYTIVIADVDTQDPERNEGVSQWQEWVVMNIPENDIHKGQVLTEYMAAGPLPNTGLHRYACLVWKQKGRLQPKEPYYSETEGDRTFSVRKFVDKYQLGIPIAANFYQAKYDASVKEVYQEANKANESAAVTA